MLWRRAGHRSRALTVLGNSCDQVRRQSCNLPGPSSAQRKWPDRLGPSNFNTLAALTLSMWPSRPGFQLPVRLLALPSRMASAQAKSGKLPNKK
jgi:hypothetical protein